jgi:glycosyltransferase involved in cell wall biosynthesis
MVMIDQDGNACQGPSDLRKCAVCPEIENTRKIRLFARIENTFPGLLPLLAALKKKIFGNRGKEQNGLGNRPMEEETLNARFKALETRLDSMVQALNNYSKMNFCVSSDVRNTFLRYGVLEDKLVVQHIGSTIAENQKVENRVLHKPLVFGNIGGVGYYKGQHILLEAAERIRSSNYLVKAFGKIDEAYLKKILRGRETLPVEFLGQYSPGDLPGILDQIDIMVLPSICSDTAPQTIFESYSAGIPIIASNIGGFPDFVKDEVNGYLFEPGNSEDLATKMEKILEDQRKVRAFSKNIPRLKTISENAKELHEIYKN